MYKLDAFLDSTIIICVDLRAGNKHRCTEIEYLVYQNKIPIKFSLVETVPLKGKREMNRYRTVYTEKMLKITFIKVPAGGRTCTCL